MCSSVPPKVSAALSAAVKVGCSLDELLQKERRISNRLQQVEELQLKERFFDLW